MPSPEQDEQKNCQGKESKNCGVANVASTRVKAVVFVEVCLCECGLEEKLEVLCEGIAEVPQELSH